MMLCERRLAAVEHQRARSARRDSHHAMYSAAIGRGPLYATIQS